MYGVGQGQQTFMHIKFKKNREQLYMTCTQRKYFFIFLKKIIIITVYNLKNK